MKTLFTTTVLLTLLSTSLFADTFGDDGEENISLSINVNQGQVLKFCRLKCTSDKLYIANAHLAYTDSENIEVKTTLGATSKKVTSSLFPGSLGKGTAMDALEKVVDKIKPCDDL